MIFSNVRHLFCTIFKDAKVNFNTKITENENESQHIVTVSAYFISDLQAANVSYV